jgi:putative oxidoreductase
MSSTRSSHPLLSHADDIAASATDALLLVGRVLVGWLFLASSAGIGGKLWNPAGFAGYLKALGAPAPELLSWIGALVETVIGAALILGSAPVTRRCSARCSSSSRPRWRTATGSTRPLK